MKKHIRVLLAAVMAVVMLASLAACTGKEEEKSYERGTVEGNVYHSEFAELTFTKPDSWKFSTDEEIAAALGVGLDVLESSDKFDASELASTIEFQAVNAATGDNAVMTVEKLNALSAATVTVDDYIKSFRETLVTQFENFSATFGDTTETTIGENTYKSISADITMSGISMRQVYLLRKVGRYMVCITLTSVGADGIPAIEAMFS